MPPDSGNLYTELPATAEGEAFQTLFQCNGTRVERIVSNRHASPPGFWYDQEASEWVAVLHGEATLEFADGRLLDLRAGDWVSIPAHVRHRVQRTGPATVWLAVHAGSGDEK
ncbi:MAG: cupin domain-containing protein [Burkholderiales bacterium]|nr:cupin domain-containing protein [Burkholderiales bacterium]